MGFSTGSHAGGRPSRRALALVARAAELGITHEPMTQTQLDSAPVEGWIHLPSQPVNLSADGPMSSSAGA